MEHGVKHSFIGGLELFSYQLSNGLTLNVVPDHSVPVVAYQTWFDVGSADEVASKTGLAHLFEHMMFKGTSAYPDGAFSADLEALGANGLNAWTWLDQTVFVQSIPSEHLEEVIRMEAIRMKQLVVDDAAFRAELDVVTNERKLVVDNSPDGLLSEHLFATAFEQHPYGNPTVGWMKDLNQLTPQDAIAFYKRYYAPNHATVYMVGDVTPEHAFAMVEKHYGTLSPSEQQRPRRVKEPKQSRQKRKQLALAMSTDRVLVGFKVPEYTHEDIPALLILDAALTSGRSGYLQRTLMDEGWVTEVSSFVLPLKDPSLWEFSLTCRKGISVESVEAEFWKRIREVATHGVSDGELAMGIAQWNAFTWSQLIGVDGKADYLGWMCTHTGSHHAALARMSMMNQVQSEDVQRVAARWLCTQQSTVIVGTAIEQSPSEPEPKSVELQRVAKVAVTARPLDPDVVWPNGEERITDCYGTRLICRRDTTLPLVYFRLKLRCGAALDPAAKRGLAYITGQMLSRGSRQRSRLAFESALEQLGGTVNIGVSSDAISIWGSSLAEHWPKLVTLLSESLEEPRFDPTDLQLLKDEVNDELRALADDDEEIAEVALRRVLYGVAHPYGRDARGTEATISSITVDDVRDFYERNVRCHRGLMGVVGAFDDHIVDDVAHLLQGIQGQPEDSFSWPNVPAQVPHEVVFVDKPDRSQCQIRLGVSRIDHSTPEFPAFVLGNDCFGVGFQSRLMQEIREKHGWSYFAYSAPSLGRGDTAWSVGFAPANDVAAVALKRVYALYDDARANGFTQAEIEQMRAARLKGMPFLIETAIKRLDLEMAKQWMDFDRIQNTEKMRTLGTDAVHFAFRETLKGPLITVIVGTWADVGASLSGVVTKPMLRISYRELL